MLKYALINKKTLLAVFISIFFIVPNKAFSKNFSESDIKDLSKSPAFKSAVKSVLEENPDILLNILEKNSDVILEIAQQGQLEKQRKIIRSQWEKDASIPKKISYSEGLVHGSSSAKVTIVEFSDFTCSYCRQAEKIIDPILKKYSKDVRFIFKPMPQLTNPNSLVAAKYILAATKQSQEKSWDFYKVIFANPSKLQESGEAFLKQEAGKLGFDVRKLSADASSKSIEDVLTNIYKEAESLNVSGTPYFFINNLVIPGVVSKELYEDAIIRSLPKGSSKSRKK